MRLTPAELEVIKALLSGVPPIVSVAVAAMAIKATRRTSQETLDHQRELARDERLWKERSAVYQEILKWGRRVQSERRRVWSDASLPFTPLHLDDVQHDMDVMRARIDAFASDEVRQLIEDWIRAQIGFDAVLVTGADFGPSWAALESVTDRLDGQIRSELGAGMNDRRPFESGTYLMRSRISL